MTRKKKDREYGADIPNGDIATPHGVVRPSPIVEPPKPKCFYSSFVVSDRLPGVVQVFDASAGGTVFGTSRTAWLADTNLRCAGVLDLAETVDLACWYLRTAGTPTRDVIDLLAHSSAQLIVSDRPVAEATLLDLMLRHSVLSECVPSRAYVGVKLAYDPTRLERAWRSLQREPTISAAQAVARQAELRQIEDDLSRQPVRRSFWSDCAPATASIVDRIRHIRSALTGTAPVADEFQVWIVLNGYSREE